MSPSSTVHGGQHDTKNVTLELLLHAAFVADEIWGFMLEPACNALGAVLRNRKNSRIILAKSKVESGPLGNKPQVSMYFKPIMKRRRGIRQTCSFLIQGGKRKHTPHPTDSDSSHLMQCAQRSRPGTSLYTNSSFRFSSFLGQTALAKTPLLGA